MRSVLALDLFVDFVVFDDVRMGLLGVVLDERDNRVVDDHVATIVDEFLVLHVLQDSSEASNRRQMSAELLEDHVLVFGVGRVRLAMLANCVDDSGVVLVDFL